MNTKKLKTFIDANFPTPNKYNIQTETDDRVVVLLDYGRTEPKMKVTIEQTYESYNLLKITNTQFI